MELTVFNVSKDSGKQLHNEIEKIAIMDGYPEKWTYPEIQPLLLKEAARRNEVKYE